MHFPRQQNCPCASPEKRAIRRREFLQLLKQPLFGHHLHMRSAFTTGQNHARQPRQIPRLPHKRVGNTQALQHAGMSFVIPLYRQYPDVHWLPEVAKSESRIVFLPCSWTARKIDRFSAPQNSNRTQMSSENDASGTQLRSSRGSRKRSNAPSRIVTSSRTVLAFLFESLRLRLICSSLLTASPSARLQQILLVHLANVQALHCVAQFLRRLQHYFRILVMRGGLHDGAGAHCRIARFEDSRADEHGLCAQLHDERGVCRSRDAPRRKIRYGQLAMFRDPSYQLERRAEFFRFVHQFFFAEQSEPLHLTDDRTHVPHRFHDVP